MFLKTYAFFEQIYVPYNKLSLILFDIKILLLNKTTPMLLYLISEFLIITLEKETTPIQHCSIRQLFILDNLALLSKIIPNPYLISAYSNFILPEPATNIKPFQL